MAISAASVELDASFHGSRGRTATTYLDDKIVLCVLESIVRDVQNQATPLADGGQQ